MKSRLRIHRARCIWVNPTSCYPTTSASVFLSFSSTTPSLFCPHRISLLNTCPYNLKLLYCTFLDISPTFAIPLILSFLMLSSLVTPLIHFHHTVCFLHCPCLGSVHHCWFYNNLYIFPLTLNLILRSHRTHDSLFQFFRPGSILCFIFTSKSPFSGNVDPRYLNVVTLSKLSPCRLISEFPS